MVVTDDVPNVTGAVVFVLPLTLHVPPADESVILRRAANRGRADIGGVRRKSSSHRPVSHAVYDELSAVPAEGDRIIHFAVIVESR